MSSSRLLQLANTIIRTTEIVDSYIVKHDLPSPSFALDGPADFGISSDTNDVEAARITAIEASWELADLLRGPMSCLRPMVCPSQHTVLNRKAARYILDVTQISLTGERRCGSSHFEVGYRD